MNRKGFLSGLIGVVLFFTLVSPVIAAPKVIINGSTFSFDTPPRIEQGTTLVPLRGIFEALGADVSWDANTQTVNASKGNTQLRLAIGSKHAYQNGTLINLSIPAKIVQGSTFVPLRFVSETLGANVSWDNKTETILIQSAAQPNNTVITNKTLTLPDGVIYTGDTLNGQPHGYGTITWPDELKYTGEFNFGKRQGEGNLAGLGIKYSGQWFNDKPHGKGRLILNERKTDQYIYEGEFTDGLPNGYGVSSLKNGCIYEGQWKDGKWHGLGKLVYLDGSMYVGEWANGKQHGQGTFTFYNGIVLSGTWVNGNPPKSSQPVVTKPNQQQNLAPNPVEPSIYTQQNIEEIRRIASRQRDLVQLNFENEKNKFTSQKDEELRICAENANMRGILQSSIFESMKQEIIDRYDYLYKQLKIERDRQLEEINAWEVSATQIR